ncbi:MAG: hypothetical protein WA323_11340 [Candidatus Nitrosopolaris sp.]
MSDNILIASLGSPNSIALKYPRRMLDHELVLDLVHELGLYLTLDDSIPPTIINIPCSCALNNLSTIFNSEIAPWALPEFKSSKDRFKCVLILLKKAYMQDRIF